MKVLKGQQERQIQDLKLRKDKVAWSKFLIEKLAEKEKAKKERDKVRADLLAHGPIAKTEEEVQQELWLAVSDDAAGLRVPIGQVRAAGARDWETGR